MTTTYVEEMCKTILNALSEFPYHVEASLSLKAGVTVFTGTAYLTTYIVRVEPGSSKSQLDVDLLNAEKGLADAAREVFKHARKRYEIDSNASFATLKVEDLGDDGA